MSISSKVRATQGKINAIPDPEGKIKSEKAAASNSADDVLSDGKEIVRLARAAKTNDAEIITTARTAQQQMETALNAAREQLQETLERAQRDFQEAATAITNNFANSIGTMETTK
jgi:DNA anti-recombination protein RmuC